MDYHLLQQNWHIKNIINFKEQHIAKQNFNTNLIKLSFDILATNI